MGGTLILFNSVMTPLKDEDLARLLLMDAEKILNLHNRRTGNSDICCSFLRWFREFESRIEDDFPAMIDRWVEYYP